MRRIRCEPDTLPSARSLPALAFYVDHSILILNAEAIRDLVALEESNTPMSVELATISKRSVDVASRLLDSLLNDEFLLELFIGFHNNQYIMICHAATEILHVSECQTISRIQPRSLLPLAGHQTRMPIDNRSL